MRPCPDILLCPICGSTLTGKDRMFRCHQGHAFDQSREGYVNLLVAGHGTSAPGDTKEMVRARRRFLDTGVFRPLSDALNQTVFEIVSARSDPGQNRERALTVLDVGCGEGYYVGRLGSYLKQQMGDRPLCLYGMDAAKEATRLGARRHTHVQFFVAYVRNRLLFPNNAVQIILNIFAPRDAAEFARVLAADGAAFVIIPNPDHLTSLRSRLPLLSLEPDKREHLIADFALAFTLLQERSLTFEVKLDAPALRDLITMTPSYWHLGEEDWKALESMGPCQVRASFTLLSFDRRPQTP